MNVEFYFSDKPNTFCNDVKIPLRKDDTQVKIKFYGTINGKEVFEEVESTIKGEKSIGNTFIQTDKYLYKPGQEVQFRLLTVSGPFMKVSYEPVRNFLNH